MKNGKKDSGFSLIELIIVIAIMAVLVGVLAPQYLKYVERSRNAVDLQNAKAIIDAVNVYYVDPERKSEPKTPTVKNKVDIIVVTSSGASANDKFSYEAITNAGLVTLNTQTINGAILGYLSESFTCKSRSRWTGYKIQYQLKQEQLVFSVVLSGVKSELKPDVTAQWKNALSISGVTYQ